MKRLLTVFLLTVVLALLAMTQGSLAETVTLPASLKAVEDEAFYGDASITEVNLPDGLESIGSKAFVVHRELQGPYLYEYVQHVQAYPANSDYALFSRVQTPEE